MREAREPDRSRELRVISNCMQALLRATDEQTLLQGICRIVCEEAGYGVAWVAYAEDKQAKSVRPAAWTGTDEGFFANLETTWADTELGRGPTGTAIRSGQCCCIRDFAADPRLAPWRENVLLGFRSGIGLPLKDDQGNTFGSLTIYAERPNAFAPDETQLLEGLAANLAFCIVSLRSRAARKGAEQEVALLSYALDKVREAAFLIDEAGRFHYVNEQACHILGYTRTELLALKVADVDPEFEAARWSEHWRDLEAQGSLSFESRHRTRDGHMFAVEVSANYFEYGGRAYNLGLVRDITERKQAEEALRESEANLNRAQAVAHIGSWYLDITRNRLTWSDEVFRIFGVPCGRPLTYEAFLDMVHAGDRETVHNAWSAALHGAPYDVEHRIVVGGEVKWVRERAQVGFSKDGAAASGIGTVQDITERKRAEEALRERADLLNLTHDAVFVMEMEGAIKYWNRGAEEQYHWTAEQAVGRVAHHLLKTVFPAPIEQVKAELMRTARWEGELVHTRKDGTRLVVASRWALQRDENGAPVAILETNNDTTERKRAEEALRQSEAYLAEAQKLSHTGSWAFDVASNRYIHVSEECLRMFGFNPKEALPTREAVFGRIHPEDSERVNRGFENLLRERVSNTDEFRIVLPGVPVKHVHVTRHAVLNDAGEVLKLVGTAVDITDRKRAEEERERLRLLEADLAHINRVSMMGELTSSIAHELNQPLSGIVSNGSACLRWLAADEPNPEEVREAVRDIVRDGRRAGEIISRIRAMTKRTAPPREKLDLNETIREVLSLAGDEAKRKDVTIRTHFADEVFPVAGDRIQLQQVGLNLVMNAIEAMSSVGERKRQLVITTRNIDANQVQVTIEDSGSGLDPNTMSRIFEPFYTTKPDGMGMGLSISRSIVQNHGGRLWAASNDGPGTSFHFTLPKHQEKGSHAGAAGV